MTLLLVLLTAHFIGDFYLQPGKWIENRHARGIKASALYKHSAVHFVLAFLALSTTQSSSVNAAGWALLIAFTHWLIDWAKSGHHGLRAFIIDQIAHILVILVVSALILDIQSEQILSYARSLKEPDSLIYLLGYIIVLNPASILISQVLARHTKILASTDNQSLGDAGRWIGYVERILALSFILVGQYTGLGFLVATKTVFRVGDLSKARDMRLTEYMMLGTLFSFAIALIIGWIILALIVRIN